MNSLIYFVKDIKLMRESDFIFDSVYLLHYKCRKVNFRGASLYIDYPDWINRKKNNNKS